MLTVSEKKCRSDSHQLQHDSFHSALQASQPTDIIEKFDEDLLYVFYSLKDGKHGY
jgi:hypothetical protein